MQKVVKQSTSSTKAVKAATTNASATKRPPLGFEEGFVLINQIILARQGLPLDPGLVEHYAIDEGLDFTDKRLTKELIHRVRNLNEDANTVLAELASRPRKRIVLAG